ncbi:MAG: glycosyltransferase family 4 protein [Saprospiraceae bacterium]
MYYNLFWALLKRIFDGKKYVITEHSTIYYSKLKYWKKLFYRLISRFSEAILPVSRRLQKAMEENGIKGDFYIIPNVVDTKLFTPKDNIKNDKTIFLHLSMLLDDHKNISGQLEAAKILNDSCYEFEYLIGGNGDNTMILDFIEKNDLQNTIKTFGALSHSEVAKIMRDADAFILFSNRENQPCVIIESFSAGTPVIATDVGGVIEYFPVGFGELISAKDIDSLIEKMKDIIDGKSYESPEKMHQYVEDNFSEIVIANQFNDIYQKMI